MSDGIERQEELDFEDSPVKNDQPILPYKKIQSLPQTKNSNINDHSEIKICDNYHDLQNDQ